MCEPSTLLPLKCGPEPWAGGGEGSLVCSSCGKAGKPWAGHFSSLGSISQQFSNGLNIEIPWLCICSPSIPEGPLEGRKSLGLQTWAPTLQPFPGDPDSGYRQAQQAGCLPLSFPETRPWTAAQYS